jgi:hypothetical protein
VTPHSSETREARRNERLHSYLGIRGQHFGENNEEEAGGNSFTGFSLLRGQD